MTPAEELRAAAQKIRDTSAKACAGPWRNNGGQVEGNGTRVATAAIAAGHDSAEHIAMWHPGAAKFVAEWLDQTATEWEKLGQLPAIAVTPLALAMFINTEVKA